MIENKYEAIKTINQSKAVRITLSPFYFESKFKRETLGHFCSRPICNKCSVYPASPGCKICGPDICTARSHGLGQAVKVHHCSASQGRRNPHS